MIEDVLENHSECHVVLGGDFSIDVDRTCTNTSALQKFCEELNLHIDVGHNLYKTDYTYHFGMKTFYTLDHFIMSEELFTDSVSGIYSLHEVDNTSDHEPICLRLDGDHLTDNVKACSFEPKIAWHKANPDHLSACRKMLRDHLASLHVPFPAVMCRDVFCKDASHTTALTEYINNMSECCLLAAKHTIPVTLPRAERGHVPGWHEDVEPKKSQSVFWHGIWVDCGRPRSGYVANIMRKTRSAYHYAIRNAKKNMKVIKSVNALLKLFLIIIVVIFGERSGAFVALVLVTVAVLMVQKVLKILRTYLENNIPVSPTIRQTWLAFKRRLRTPSQILIVTA